MKRILLTISILLIFSTSVLSNEGEEIKFTSLLMREYATIYRSPSESEDVIVYRDIKKFVDYAKKWEININIEPFDSSKHVVMVVLIDNGGMIGSPIYVDKIKWVFPDSPINNIYIDIGYVGVKCHCTIAPNGKKTTHVAIIAVGKGIIRPGANITFREPVGKKIEYN